MFDNPLFKPLRVREFRLFWVATAISLVGDQLTLIALPWLVLKLTHDAFAMGVVLAVAAVPRAVFILFGGAITDRASPRRVLLISNAVRLLLVGVLALLVYADSIFMWQVYVIAAAFGVADAFMFPASGVMPPRLLENELLAPGNSLIQGTANVSVIVGPAFAGLVIAGLSGGGASFDDQLGLTVAFAVDTLTFVIPVVVFAIIRERFPAEDETAGSGIIASIVDGFRYAWADPSVRMLALMIAVLALAFRGPFMVGLPAFADQLLPQGAAGYGTMVSALGVGALAGILAAAYIRHPPAHWLGALLLIDFGIYGVLFIGLTFVRDLVTICLMIFAAAILDGFVMVIFPTWLQQRVPRARMGRVFSVIMFFNMGLAPVSSAVAGWIARWDLLALLMGGGVLLLVISIVGGLIRPVRRMGYEV